MHYNRDEKERDGKEPTGKRVASHDTLARDDPSNKKDGDGQNDHGEVAKANQPTFVPACQPDHETDRERHRVHDRHEAATARSIGDVAARDRMNGAIAPRVFGPYQGQRSTLG